MYHLITICKKQKQDHNRISPKFKNTDVYFVQNKLQVDTNLNIYPPPPPPSDDPKNGLKVNQKHCRYPDL